MLQLFTSFLECARLWLQLRVIRARWELERDINATLDSEEDEIARLEWSVERFAPPHAKRLQDRRAARAGVIADIRASLARTNVGSPRADP